LKGKSTLIILCICKAKHNKLAQLFLEKSKWIIGLLLVCPGCIVCCSIWLNSYIPVCKISESFVQYCLKNQDLSLTVYLKFIKGHPLALFVVQFDMLLLRTEKWEHIHSNVNVLLFYKNVGWMEMIFKQIGAEVEWLF
jgi:hypothetical protein